MRVPRLRIWMVMALVVAVAVALGIEHTWGRWSYLRKQAAIHAQAEARHRKEARKMWEASLTEPSGFWAVSAWDSVYCEEWAAEYEATLKRHYEQAAARFWEPLKPEPLRPPWKPAPPPSPNWQALRKSRRSVTSPPPPA